ncbi:hypothetical protein [Tautonia sociabilis]|uniref:Uncharacterized protein n=1 Tax=Tautonia sociabilis TaxID=2080755 RepID=A0A432MK16_9BACT|nr:hypothetical protein [Tautonia sociabilis]RUL87468.1 hypothetical protein TsocGM_12370 [Tautonia sociabilis]
MAIREPRAGPGPFQWNGGAWLGSLLGGTAWLLVGAVSLAARAPTAALCWLACFAATNAVGGWLWSRRDRIRPGPAIQALLLTIGLGGLLAFLSLERFAPSAIDSVLEGRRSYLVLLIVPALMIWFALLDRQARQEAGPAGRR